MGVGFGIWSEIPLFWAIAPMRDLTEVMYDGLESSLDLVEIRVSLGEGGVYLSFWDVLSGRDYDLDLEFGHVFPCFGPRFPGGFLQWMMMGSLGSYLNLGGCDRRIRWFGLYFSDLVVLNRDGWELVLEFG